jgi:hypothetical protein
MAWNLHAFVNRISAAHGGRNLEYGGVAAKLQLLILQLVTLLIVGCGSGCDAAAHEISMPEVQFDGGFALLRRAAMEQVVQTGESQVLRLELLRRDTYPSLANSTSTTAPPKSSAERFLEIVKRSHARRDAIARSMQLAAHGQSSAKGAVDAELAPNKRAKPSLSIPVSEDGNEGEFQTQIALGTPKQSFTAIVDTGSDLVWTQCLPCELCFPQTGPEFNPAKSSTYKPIKCGLHNLCEDLPEITGCPTAGCQYLYEYGGGGRTSGNLATDTVTFGNASVPSLGFGCGHNNTGFAGLDGIVGLGQGPLSLISQLSNAGVISKRFSYCLVSYSSQNSSPLLLGDLAVTSAPPGVAYTPIQANPVYPTYYYLHLDGISVAGILLKYPPATFAIDSSGNGGLILDSGTTITYLATDAYSAVLEAVQANLIYPLVSGIPYGLDLCFDVGSAINNPILPEMVFHFTNADVVLPIENLFLLADVTRSIV